MRLTGGLMTSRTHERCQSDYARDEEYFCNTLLPNALASRVGPLLAHDFRHLIRQDEIAERLSETVRRQFDELLEGVPRRLIPIPSLWRDVVDVGAFAEELIEELIEGHGDSGSFPISLPSLIQRNLACQP